MYKNEKIIVDAADAGRLDSYLAAAMPEISRSRWKTLIREGAVAVNGSACKPNRRLHAGDELSWSLPEAVPEEPQPEYIPLDILYEDDAVLVLNKPPGLVVHPAAGNESGTLVNALLFHDPVFRTVNRAGIVHRLDKDTSGVMVAARSDKVMDSLQQQFKERQVEKMYLALVWGHPPPEGRIENRIGRHSVYRQKMAVLQEGGREAVTHFKVLEPFSAAALIRVHIETGRTHQIRVHMAHAGHPVIGDGVYGRTRERTLPLKPERQMLHAAKLTFTHPASGKRLSFEAPLPDDMQRLLERLHNDG